MKDAMPSRISLRWSGNALMDRRRTSVAAWRTAPSACTVYPAQQPPGNLPNPNLQYIGESLLAMRAVYLLLLSHRRPCMHGAQKKPHQGVLLQGVLHPRIQARCMEGSTRQWQRLAGQEPCPLAGLQLSSCTSLRGSERLEVLCENVAILPGLVWLSKHQLNTCFCLCTRAVFHALRFWTQCRTYA